MLLCTRESSLVIIFMSCYYNIKLKYLPSDTKYPDRENLNQS